MAMTQQRLSGEERCEAIRMAMRKVFAEKGFEGTTTRDLAKAAGVSEALLYRHFPSKQAMYEAMTTACLGERGAEEFKQIIAMEPSASTLVLLIHFTISHMVFEAKADGKETDLLLVRSLLEDGELARVMYETRGHVWHKKVRESLLAARKAGEAHDGAPVDEIAGWLAKSVGFGMSLLLRPAKPVVDVELSREELTERCVWFILLGLGLKPEAIKRYYNPKGLRLLAVAG